ncbi:TRAP transporter substrate-binding protein [Comamonas faecalis]|uniref:TRAP transporter substrate-binding protein n=1 Tax=Comamonas faecalis TaxID=1387849 RepID=A0ABP7RI50_9BURK
MSLADSRLDRRRCLQALALAAVPAWAQQDGSITIRLSHVVARQTPKGLALERFRDNVARASGGRIRVQVYPNSLLYGDADEMQALQLGAVDMLAPSLSKFGPVGFPEFELFDLPFLFATAQQVHRITQGALGRELLAGLSRQGLVGLGYLDNGFKHMSANRALLAPQDFIGLRMRIQASRVIAHQMRVLGAHPVVLSFGEAYRALALDVVDGTENPISNFWTQRMHEVQIDLSLTGHGWLGYAVVANQRFWRFLASTDRALVARALDEALQWGNAIAQRENDAALAALHASGATRIHDLSRAQRQRLQQALRPVHQGLVQRIGAAWLQRVQAQLG